MFEWIASHFGSGAAVAAAVLCGAAGVGIAIQGARRISTSEVPWLLRRGMLVALVAALFCFPACVAGLLGSIEVQGDLSPRGELVVLGSLATLFAVLGASSLAYYFDRPWSRHLAVAFWPLLWACLFLQSRWVPGFGASELFVVTAEVLLLAVASAWYFYCKQTVVKYYERLERAAFYDDDPVKPSFS